MRASLHVNIRRHSSLQLLFEVQSCRHHHPCILCTSRRLNIEWCTSVRFLDHARCSTIATIAYHVHADSVVSDASDDSVQRQWQYHQKDCQDDDFMARRSVLVRWVKARVDCRRWARENWKPELGHWRRTHFTTEFLVLRGPGGTSFRLAHLGSDPIDC